jgi:flagellar protein FliJ
MTTPRRFPLDVVLRVREVRERLSRGGMARAQIEELEAQQNVDAAHSVLERTFAPQVADPQTFIAAFTARQSMASQVRALEVLREVRREATAEATAAWRLTEQDRAGVQKLADRHLDAVVADDLAAEQHALDDVRRMPADEAIDLNEVER